MAGGKQTESMKLSALQGIEDGLRLVGASLRLREDHAQGYERGEDNEERD